MLIAAVGALALSVMAFMGSREWDALTDRFSLFFTIAMDIQVLIGILVWITDEQARGDTFLAWVHPLAMLLAAGLAHAGRALSERAVGSEAKGRTAIMFFGGSLALILIAIPLGSWPL